MRKGVIFGFVVLLIALPLFFMSPGDPVERHKRAYQAARKKITGRDWFTPIEEFYCKTTKRSRWTRSLTTNEIQTLQAQLNSNRIALVNLGFLVERTFIISNQPVDVVSARVSAPFCAMLPRARERYTSLDCLPRPNVLVVTGFSQDMPAWESAITKADVFP